MLLITSVLEFIIGNTFPCVVFGTIGMFFYLIERSLDHSFILLILYQGGFWFAFAATMVPAFNAAGQFEYTIPSKWSYQFAYIL